MHAPGPGFSVTKQQNMFGSTVLSAEHFLILFDFCQGRARAQATRTGLMDYPRRRNAMAIQQRAIRPPWRNHGVSVAEPSYEWWAPARPKPGDSQEQVRLRLASANALNQIPRDPRYYEPVKEANWTVNTSLNGHFIPEYDITGGDNINCVHQIEPFISRPASKARADFVSQRLSLGKRSSPLLSYNSLGWNRRHYEPVPDVTRVVTFKNAYDGNISMASRMSSPSGRPASRALSWSGSEIGSPRQGSPIPPLSPNERSAAYLEGYLNSPSGTHPSNSFAVPRIAGIDTYSRPPLVVHSTDALRRTAWIGTRG